MTAVPKNGGFDHKLITYILLALLGAGTAGSYVRGNPGDELSKERDERQGRQIAAVEARVTAIEHGRTVTASDTAAIKVSLEAIKDDIREMKTEVRGVKALQESTSEKIHQLDVAVAKLLNGRK